MSSKRTIKNLLAGLLAACSLQAGAQTAYEQGQSTVTLGYGFPNLYKTILKSALQDNAQNYYEYNLSTKRTVKGYGPLFLKYEYALTKLIGVGAVVGYWSTTYTETHDYYEEEYNNNTNTYEMVNYHDISKYKFTSFSAGARLNFHFGTGEKLDPYAGIAGGYTSLNYDFTYDSNNPDQVATPVHYTGIPIYFAMSAGLRYYFTENIGAYAEVGIDKLSVIQGGLAIKF